MGFRGQPAGIAAQGGTSQFVIVTLERRLFAIDAAAVQGIMDAPEVAHHPAPEFQGALYQVIDLTSRLATKGSREQRSSQLVLLLRDRMRGSVGVEQVHGRMDLQESQILPLPPHFQGAERDWYRGIILFENSIVLILNLSWVLNNASQEPRHRDRTSLSPMSAAGPEMPRSEC